MALARDSGLNWIAGGLVAALVLPALAVGLGLPFWLALAIALCAGGGTCVLLLPRRPFDGLNAAVIGRGRIELVRELLEEAQPQVARLDAAAAAIAARAVHRRVDHLARMAEDILAAVEREPLKIDRARRFMTYYLPRSVEMAEGYRLLEQRRAPDPARLDATGGLIDRLDEAFVKYADGMRDADIDRLDIELKLLTSSLDEDLGPVAGKPTAALPRQGA